MSGRKILSVETILVFALLLGAGLFAAGCCCTCPKYVGENGPEPVNIQITWNTAARIIVVFPNSAQLCEGKQYARWILSGAPEGTKMTIAFPEGGSPFLTGKEKEIWSGPVVKSGVPRAGTKGNRYKYSVTLTLPGSEPVTLDPHIEIW